MICRRLPSPGGTEPLKRALFLCSLSPRSLLLDVGCGKGEFVKYVANDTDYSIFGVDADGAALEDAPPGCLFANAASLPFRDKMFDAVFFGCSFSKIEDADGALSESRRVLKECGKIAIADFYAKEEEARFQNILGRVERRETIEARLVKNSFKPYIFEDRTKEMRELWGQLIFDCGKEELQELFGDCSALCSLKCGYGLFMAEAVS